MTTEQLEKMAAGRERATKARHIREDEQLELFRRWLSDERKAWVRLQFTREVYEPNSPEVEEAYAEWWLAYADSPQLPPDSAFRRDRGEDATDSDAS
jgi:hypothetical protein